MTSRGALLRTGSLEVLLMVALGACCPRGAMAPPPASAGQASGAASVPTIQPPPSTEEGCRACNGDWGRHGLAAEPKCNCRTRDAGKTCRDGADCEGMCVAGEQPERQVVSPGPPPRGYFLGRCSALVTVFGCNRLIERGAAAQGPTSLEELPPALCVD